MAYYADLTPYEYVTYTDNIKRVNIGWLEKGHSFTTGKVDLSIISKIGELCKLRLNGMRGFQRCHFCNEPPFGFPVVIDNKTIYLGSAEIHVPGANGMIYAAPNLIYHYIKDHDYLPPEEFVTALRNFTPENINMNIPEWCSLEQVHKDLRKELGLM